MGGPARLYSLISTQSSVANGTWNINITIRNIHSLSTSGGCNVNGCNTLTLNGCQWDNLGPGASAIYSVVASNTLLNGVGPSEFDKIVENVTMTNCGGALFLQSACPANMSFTNGPSSGIQFTGTGINLSLTGGQHFMRAGCGFGRGGTLTISSNVTLISTLAGFPQWLYSSNATIVSSVPGLLSYIKPSTANGLDNNTHAAAIPGREYAIFASGVPNYNSSVGIVKFCITDLYDDATTIYMQTDLSPFPNSSAYTFSGSPGNGFYCYPWNEQPSVTGGSTVDWDNTYFGGGANILQSYAPDVCPMTINSTTSSSAAPSPSNITFYFPHVTAPSIMRGRGAGA